MIAFNRVCLQIVWHSGFEDCLAEGIFTCCLGKGILACSLAEGIGK